MDIGSFFLHYNPNKSSLQTSHWLAASPKCLIKSKSCWIQWKLLPYMYKIGVFLLLYSYSPILTWLLALRESSVEMASAVSHGIKEAARGLLRIREYWLPPHQDQESPMVILGSTLVQSVAQIQVAHVRLSGIGVGDRIQQQQPVLAASFLGLNHQPPLTSTGWVIQKLSTNW